MTFDTKYGKVTYDPATGETLLYLKELGKKPVSAHGSLKRLILTLAFQRSKKFSLPYASMN